MKKLQYDYEARKLQLKIMFYNPKVYLTVLLVGLITHGFSLFNEFSFHDGASYVAGEVSGIHLNRWMLNVLSACERYWLGTGFHSSTIISGILTLMFIALAASIVVSMFEINSTVGQCTVSAIMVTIPCVAALLGYLMVAAYYTMAMFLAVVAAYFACNGKSIGKFVIAVVCLCCSLGIYQAYLPTFLSVVLLYMIIHMYIDEGYVKSICMRIGYCAGISLVSLITYALIGKVACELCLVELSAYAGISDVSHISLQTYLYRIVVAYGEFIYPMPGKCFNIYSDIVLFVYYLVLVFVLIVAVSMIVIVWKKSTKRAVLITIGFICAPLAINFIFIMTQASSVHALMYYSQFTIIVFVCWAWEQLIYEKIFVKLNTRLFQYMMIGICMWMNAMFIKLDNICYQKAYYQQENAKIYFTELMTRIQSCDGYRSGMPVIYLNEFEKKSTYYINDEWEKILINPYNETDLINNYNWKTFMSNWCGFNPVLGEICVIKNFSEIDQMPHYPDDGSIRIINEMVVVNF